MCGFYGRFTNAENLDIDTNINLCKSLSCRGPDSDGFTAGDWKTRNINLIQNNYLNQNQENSYNNFFLKHYRLEILDLDHKASQPMFLESKNKVIVFNGEIYNYRELKNGLKKKGYNFFTDHSDTEIILKGYEYWGKDIVQHLDGQFSLVIYDLENQSVFLARDPMGQKPLYYAQINGEFILSSTLFPILRTLRGRKQISNKSLNTYINLGVVPSPNTMYKEVKQLMPGEYMEFDLSSWSNTYKDFYWKKQDYITKDTVYEQEVFNQIFSDAVKKRLVSDVPVAAFLSGGLDSTAVIKAISQTGEDVRSFSVVFEDKLYDESEWIDQVVGKYNLTNTKETFVSSDLDSLIIKASNSFEEPFYDPSQIPTYIISESISKKYKVALSGDGSDELMYGYQRSELAYKQILSGKLDFIKKLNSHKWFHKAGVGRKFIQFDKELKSRYFSYFEDKNLLKLLDIDKSYHELNLYWDLDQDPLKQIQLFELGLYTSEFMNLKIDRTSMKNSLEVRSPFEDRKLIEYLLSCNLNENILNNKKFPVKNYLASDFSSNFLNRKKKGFSFPVYEYIYSQKSELLDLLFDNSSYVVSDLGFNIEKIYKRKNLANAHRIWKLLMLELWMNRVKNSELDT